MDIKQNPSGSVSWYSSVEGLDLFYAGGPKNPQQGTNGSSANAAALSGHNWRGVQRMKIHLFNGTFGITASAALWQNTLDGDLLIGLTTIVAATGQDTTFNISIGTGTLSANVEAKGAFNNLIDTLNYAGLTVVGIIGNNIEDHGTNGKSKQYLKVGDVIGAQILTHAALTADLFAYIEVIKV